VGSVEQLAMAKAAERTGLAVGAKHPPPELLLVYASQSGDLNVATLKLAIRHRLSGAE